jgi:hypothetical protein
MAYEFYALALSRLPFDKLRAGKAAPTVTPRTVAYSDILIYDLPSTLRITVIQSIGYELEGLESI